MRGGSIGRRLLAAGCGAAVVLSLGIGVADATVPGKNGKLLFGSQMWPESILNQIDPSGRNPQSERLPGFEFGLKAYDGSYSPDGKRIAYVGWKDQLRLATSSDAGWETRPITQKPPMDCCYIDGPVFDPSGKSVIYASGDPIDSRYQLFEATIGAEPVITERGWYDAPFSFDVSPNGRKIAYSTFTDGKTTIKLMNRDETDKVAVATGNLSADMPSFSPDGRSLAFVGGEGVDKEIYVVGTDGSGMRALTSTGGLKRSPVFSPDGQEVAFALRTDENVGRGIKRVGLDGSAERFMVEGSEVGHLDDWQRAAPFVIHGTQPGRRLLNVSLFGPGRLSIAGPQIRPAKKAVSGKSRTSIGLKPNKKLRDRLDKKGRAKIKVTVRFAPEGGLPNSLTRRIVLKR